MAKVQISTHALREEGDRFQTRAHPEKAAFLPTPSVRRATGKSTQDGTPSPISTHALREEGDRCFGGSIWLKYRFLPTPSVRRATRRAPQQARQTADFYPRPP